MKCTCPIHTIDGQVVKAGLDALCPVHGPMRPIVKTKAQMMLESLRDDMTAAPCRSLSAKEQQFVADAVKGEFVVLYDRKGKPFAWGAPKNVHMFSANVSSRPWLFDIAKVKSHFYWLA